MNRFNDLNSLNNIINDIEIEEICINDNEYNDILDNLYLYMDDYYKQNIMYLHNKDFEDDVYDYIYDNILIIYEDVLYLLDIDKIMTDLFDKYYIKNHYRSYPYSLIIKQLTELDKIRIDKLFKYYDSVQQPEQKTDEWYDFRHNLLTASSIWKCLGTPAAKNSLILSKCKPLNKKKYDSVNINSAFHNGHKYEDLSILLYEYMFNTKIKDYGCIAHKQHKFIGASPDGINCKRDNNRYGRMLEIKNPVSRVLTGIPKQDYWIQMQIQMEVWDLNECDFYETCFKEYDNEQDFYKDGINFNKTNDNKHKGIFIMFHKDNKPYYVYPKINITKDEFDIWYDDCINTHNDITWIKNIYWYLDTSSLVLITRNKLWFNSVLPEFKKIYDIIVKERVDGYSHRLPTINKPNKKKFNTERSIFKIRTESFDDS